LSPKASATQPDAKANPSSAGKKSQVADAKDLPPLTKEPPASKKKEAQNVEENPKGPEDNKEWNNGKPLDADKHIEQPVKVDDLKAAAADGQEKKEGQQIPPAH
jgi:hypothetical protein